MLVSVVTNQIGNVLVKRKVKMIDEIDTMRFPKGSGIPVDKKPDEITEDNIEIVESWNNMEMWYDLKINLKTTQKQAWELKQFILSRCSKEAIYKEQMWDYCQNLNTEEWIKICEQYKLTEPEQAMKFIKQNAEIAERLRERLKYLEKLVEGKEDIEWGQDSSLGNIDREIKILKVMLGDKK